MSATLKAESLDTERVFYPEINGWGDPIVPKRLRVLAALHSVSVLYSNDHGAGWSKVEAFFLTGHASGQGCPSFNHDTLFCLDVMLGIEGSSNEELHFGFASQGLRRYVRWDDDQCMEDEHFLYWAMTHIEAQTGVNIDGSDFSEDDEIVFCLLMAEFFADIGL